MSCLNHPRDAVKIKIHKMFFPATRRLHVLAFTCKILHPHRTARSVPVRPVCRADNLAAVVGCLLLPEEQAVRDLAAVGGIRILAAVGEVASMGLKAIVPGLAGLGRVGRAKRLARKEQMVRCWVGNLVAPVVLVAKEGMHTPGAPEDHLEVRQRIGVDQLESRNGP